MTSHTPKVSSRPRSGVPMSSRPPTSHLRSPPLTTSLNSNSPQYPFLDNSPSHMLSGKEGARKLKIKSATTPEARPRLGLKPLGARTPGTHTPSRSLHRAITPSESEGSLADAWLGPPSDLRIGDASNSDALEPTAELLGETETVLVSVRVRPPNTVELQMKDAENVWTTPTSFEHIIKLHKGGRDDKEWIFDRVISPEADNTRVYNTSARAHVRSAMEGFNALIFAYGQTASGKTFTLSGSPSQPGIIPLAISDLFAQIRSTPDREFLLRASYLELYNETIIDLLGDGRELTLSEVKKGEVVVNGLTECAVRTEAEVKGLLQNGEQRRRVGATDWNARSSRSHCVFRIVIESRAARSQSDDTLLVAQTPGGRSKVAGERMTRISTLSIIDLAGSEKYTSSKERNAEGKHINQSLLTLKLVISKLADLASKRNVTHVPYRDSKLTRILQPSLSGDALISVICTISPSAVNVSESLSTLAFAQGLKRVVLKAQRKEVVDPQALIQQYQNEIAELRALLREKESGSMSDQLGKDERQKNAAMETRLKELKSMILTSVNVTSSGHPVPSQVGNPSFQVEPTTMKYPKLDFDRSTTQLQEDLHAAQLRVAEQNDEILRMRAGLEARPLRPDQRIVELQEEIAGLKMIAADYERHLREPTRKVREDVEREYAGKISKLEDALESKRIWANRLDENIRAVAGENKLLQARCQEAEAKVMQIVEWVNDVLSDSPPHSSTFDPTLPSLTVSQDGVPSMVDDFSPALPSNARFSKMARTQLSQMDLAKFNDRFGSLTVGGGRRGTVKMLREESQFGLAEMGQEEVF